MTAEPYAALTAARPDDLFLRYDVRADQVVRALVEGTAVAWVSDHPFRQVRWLTVLADAAPDAAALAARAVQDEPDVDGLTVPVDALPFLDPPVAPPDPDRWCWWCTSTAPRVRPGEATAVDLALDDPRIPGLLAHSTSASADPGDPRIRRWLGVEDGGGALLACAAHVEHVLGVPHLASVVTHPDARGRGLASDLCARLTRDALAAGAAVVTLGMYSSNDVARGVYTRLGFAIAGDFASGYLPGRTAHPEADPLRESPADAAGTA